MTDCLKDVFYVGINRGMAIKFPQASAAQKLWTTNGREVKIGDEAAVAVFAEISHVLEKLQLSDWLAVISTLVRSWVRLYLMRLLNRRLSKSSLLIISPTTGLPNKAPRTE